jgi:hypothetical protein
MNWTYFAARRVWGYYRKPKRKNMKDTNRIKVPEGSDGQQPQYPGDGHAPESGTDSTEKTDSRPEGTRQPERIHIPVVR